MVLLYKFLAYLTGLPSGLDAPATQETAESRS
jgi:hypothetical protein